MPAYTKLSAVNEMLEAIGEDPVSTLDSGLTDADAALRRLETASRRIQSIGWNFNTEELTLTPDTNGEIIVPNGVVKIDSTGVDAYRRIVLRGSKLYDLDNNTFKFTRKVRVEVVWEFDFDELPLPLQEYILSHAGRLFQEGQIGSVALDNFSLRREQEAYAEWLDADAQEADSNIITGSSSVNAVAYRRNRLYGM